MRASLRSLAPLRIAAYDDNWPPDADRCRNNAIATDQKTAY
jgi:hypothetical protein